MSLSNLTYDENISWIVLFWAVYVLHVCLLLSLQYPLTRLRSDDAVDLWRPADLNIRLISGVRKLVFKSASGVRRARLPAVDARKPCEPRAASPAQPTARDETTFRAALSLQVLISHRKSAFVTWPLASTPLPIRLPFPEPVIHTD